MPRSIPTPDQQRILHLLNAADYLTTRQIDEYLGGTTSKRTTERWLKKLAEYGFVQSSLQHPERGAASERCWTSLKKVENSIEPAEGMTITQGGYGSKAIAAKGSVTPVLTSPQMTVLLLLTRMKHLTTKQIRQHSYADRPEWYTWKLLSLLRGRGYISSDRLRPERGAASELFWAITRHGAAEIGIVNRRSYRCHPTRQTIEYRGMLLEMGDQVRRAGWSLISPPVPSPGRAQIEETPQRRQLVEAVLKKEGLAIEKLLMQGYPASRLGDRIDRWNTGQVGALVPRTVKEYVAFVPGQPERTALLIPHPPLAGRTFWTRSPGVRADHGGRYNRTSSRLTRYSRLAQVLPVVAVFGSEATGREYARMLEASGFGWTGVRDIGAKLLVIAEASSRGDQAVHYLGR